MNIEQMKKIVNGSPSGYEIYKGVRVYKKTGTGSYLSIPVGGGKETDKLRVLADTNTHNLSDLRTIIAQAEDIERLKAYLKRFEWRKVKDEQPPTDTVLTWRIPLNVGGHCYFTGFQSLESGELCEVPYGDVFTGYEVTDDTQWCYIAADDEHSPQTSLAERDAEVARKAFMAALHTDMQAGEEEQKADEYVAKLILKKKRINSKCKY